MPLLQSLPFSLLALVATCHLCHSAILSDNGEEEIVRKMPQTTANKREEAAFLKVEVILKSDWPSPELDNNANLAQFKLALYEVEKPETGIWGIYDKNSAGEEIFVFENVPMEWVKTEQKMEGEKGKGKMPTAWTKPKSTELEMQIELPTRQKILRRFCSPELKEAIKNKGIRILRVEIGQKHFYKVSLFPDGLFAPHNFQLPPGKGPLIKLPAAPENGGKKMERKKEIIGGLNYCIQQWAYCRGKRASLVGELKTALVEEREEFEKEQLYRDLEWRLFSLANSHQKLLADYAKEFVIRTEAIKNKLFGIMAIIVAYEVYILQNQNDYFKYRQENTYEASLHLPELRQYDKTENELEKLFSELQQMLGLFSEGKFKGKGGNSQNGPMEKQAKPPGGIERELLQMLGIIDKRGKRIGKRDRDVVDGENGGAKKAKSEREH